MPAAPRGWPVPRKPPQLHVNPPAEPRRLPGLPSYSSPLKLAPSSWLGEQQGMLHSRSCHASGRGAASSHTAQPCEGPVGPVWRQQGCSRGSGTRC